MSKTNNISNGSYWLCPIWDFFCDLENIGLAEGVKIIRTPSKFEKYLEQHISYIPQTMVNESDWAILIPYNRLPNMSATDDLFEKVPPKGEHESDVLTDLITTLRLYKKGRVRVWGLTRARFRNNNWSIEGKSIWTPVSSMEFVDEPSTYRFIKSDYPKINCLFTYIRSMRKSNVLDKLSIAIYRFHSAYHGPIEDRLIDQMIALESLYLGSEQEVLYKLASRAAFLLRKRKDHRNILFSDLKKAYNFRSRIVHGNNPPSRDEINFISHKTEDYLRQSIIKFLTLLSKGYSLKNLKQGNKGKLAQLDENVLTNGKLL